MGVELSGFSVRFEFMIQRKMRNYLHANAR